MRISELFEQQPETWETRHRAFQRQQAKRVKAAGKLADTKARKAEADRRDAARRSADNRRVADRRRDLAAT
jgi:hypothetical protein